MKAIVVGSQGRMGREVVHLLEEEKSHSFVGGMDKTMGAQWTSLDQIDREADVVIDFSTADFFAEVLSWCENNQTPLVSGTTGLKENDFQQIEDATRKIAVLWAPNMSLGIAFINELLQYFGGLEGFDFQITEAHHRYKKDSPSGTALFLQETLEKWASESPPKPVSIRGGGIYGVHRLEAMSDEEVITLQHEALNRSIFARGAIRAAQWVISQSPGRYHLKDLLSQGDK